VNAPAPAAAASDVLPNGASIAVRNLSVTYANGFTAVRDASFQLDPGTICALVGVNGSQVDHLQGDHGFVRRPRRGAALRNAGR
jgi:ABC-type uncharacterized transport system ATPase subunit